MKAVYTPIVLLLTSIIFLFACAGQASSPANANFIVRKLVSNPAIAKQSENISIEATISNIGGKAGNYPATLYIDGVARDSKTIYVGPSENKTAVFEIAEFKIGVHEARIDTAYASFEVKEYVPVVMATDISGLRASIDKKVIVKGVLACVLPKTVKWPAEVVTGEPNIITHMVPAEIRQKLDAIPSDDVYLMLAGKSSPSLAACSNLEELQKVNFHAFVRATNFYKYITYATTTGWKVEGDNPIYSVEDMRYRGVNYYYSPFVTLLNMQIQIKGRIQIDMNQPSIELTDGSEIGLDQ